MDLNEITEVATNWCRMWSEDPALAHDLMAQECRQWSGVTAGLDVVVGPSQQEHFVTAYRAQHVNVFAARTVVADGDTFAYLWDVTLPSGTVKTGIDVNVLHNRLVQDNWTFVADSHMKEPDPAPGDRMSEGSLLTLVSDWAGDRGYAVHRRPVLDPANGRAVLLHTSTTDDGAQVGGVDMLTVRDGYVESIWSITGTRAFSY